VICMWLADATATTLSVAALQSRMVCYFGAGLPRLSWKRGCEMRVCVDVNFH